MILMLVTVDNTVSLFHYYIQDRTCSDWQYVVDDLFEKITKKVLKLKIMFLKTNLMIFGQIWKILMFLMNFVN